jgi:hypothetical protein
MRFASSTALPFALVATGLSLVIAFAQEYTVRQGNIIHVVLDQEVSSVTVRVGDRVVTHCQSGDCGGFPHGTKFYARITDAGSANKSRSGYFRGTFTTAVLPDGMQVPIEAQAVAPPAEGKTSTKKGTKNRNAVIGAAAGGLIGGDWAGAIVGAGAGYLTGKDKKTEATDITIQAGTTFDIRMLKTVTYRTPAPKK